MRFRLVSKSVTLDDRELLQVQILTEFCATSHIWEATTAKQMKIVPVANDSSFWKYKAYADIRGGSPWRWRQMTVRLSTTVIFGDLSGYFFGNVRDKTSTWRYATSCWPVIDCKMND